MYEDKYKNISSTAKRDLDSFLNLLADLNEEIELFAIGGTAMVIKGIKEATKDIDFLTTKDYEAMRKLLNRSGLKEKSNSKLCNIWYLEDIRIDLFYDEFILGVPLQEDWKEKSEFIIKKGKIKIYILNWYDVIITKIARSQQRDIEDIKDIIKSEKINVNELKKRYYKLAPTALITDYDYKFKHLIREINKK